MAQIQQTCRLVLSKLHQWQVQSLTAEVSLFAHVQASGAQSITTDLTRTKACWPWRWQLYKEYQRVMVLQDPWYSRNCIKLYQIVLIDLFLVLPTCAPILYDVRSFVFRKSTLICPAFQTHTAVCLMFTVYYSMYLCTVQAVLPGMYIWYIIN